VGKVKVSKIVPLKERTFILIKQINYDDAYYLLNENKNSLVYKDRQYDFYNYNGSYKFNLTPYSSTVNITSYDSVIIGRNVLGHEGYYINKADINNVGTVIQSMMVPQKGDPNIMVPTTKAINNKCSSKVRNVCVSVEEGKFIKRGSPCVVTEGSYKGMYIAIGEISKTSATTNCVKYDSGISTLCNVIGNICKKPLMEVQ